MGGAVLPAGSTKTVAVLGASYGGPYMMLTFFQPELTNLTIKGAHAAQVLAANLPDDWRVILIDRNSHMNHLYVMPRFAVLPGHEFKAFIPYTNVFLLDSETTRHVHLQAIVTSIRPNHITISRSFPDLGIPTTTIPFDYVIYALGAVLPPPLNLWKSPEETATEGLRTVLQFSGSKPEGCEWLKSKQRLIEQAPTVLVVGGGALGIQFATDIKDVYPTKKVTLLHSRLRLLPRFDERMHNEVVKTCGNMGIELILGERLDLESVKNAPTETTQRIVRTVSGREIAADLILLCIGQSPNTDLLKKMDPQTVRQDNAMARVLRTMQLYSPPTSIDSVESETAYPHIFAIGDSSDAFGAIQAGHTAYAQGDVAAWNIIRLIQNREVKSQNSNQELQQLQHYIPGPPGIKVSLGLKRTIRQTGPSPTIEISDDGVPDHHAASMWPFFGIKVEKDEDMKI